MFWSPPIVMLCELHSDCLSRCESLTPVRIRIIRASHLNDNRIGVRMSLERGVSASLRLVHMSHTRSKTHSHSPVQTPSKS